MSHDVSHGTIMRSSLSTLGNKQPLSRPEVRAELAKAWLDHGIAVLHLDQIEDAATREGVIECCNRLFGLRRL